VLPVHCSDLPLTMRPLFFWSHRPSRSLLIVLPLLVAHEHNRKIVGVQGMTEIAREAGLSLSSLYKGLSPAGNPEFATVASVLKSLGLRLSVAA
jgi:Probable addiction module antidote protein